MDAKDINTITQELFAHMHEHDGLNISFASWHIGVAPSIEQCRFRKHPVASDEYAYIIRRALTDEQAKAIYDYLLSLDFEIDEESSKQKGIYVYACIKNLEDRKAKSSSLAGCVVDGIEFLRHYKMGERNFSEIFLRNVVLQNETLESLNLSRARISNIHLTNVSLRESKIDSAVIENAVLENVDLGNSDLSRSSIKKSTLKQVNLKNSCLSDAKLTQVNVEDSDLTRINAETLVASDGAADSFQHSSLVNCCLVRSNFQNSTISGLALKNSDLTEVDMRESEVMVISVSDNSIRILPRERSGYLPKSSVSIEHIDDFIKQLNQDNVVLNNTVMPDGRIYSNFTGE